MAHLAMNSGVVFKLHVAFILRFIKYACIENGFAVIAREMHGFLDGDFRYIEDREESSCRHEHHY